MEEINILLSIIFRFFDLFFKELQIDYIPLGYLLLAPILFKIVMNNLVLKAKSVKDTRKEMTINHGDVQSKNQ